MAYRFPLPGAVLVAAVLVGGCDTTAPDETAPAPDRLVAVPVPDGFAPLPVPESSPLLARRVRLGERLFFDTELSRDRTVSCGSCHLPERAFSDGLPQSVGIGGAQGLRNAPSLLNVAYRTTLFWDGRSGSLERQALLPIEDAHEMDLPVAEALARLTANPAYAALFPEAFAGEGPTEHTLADALAAFQRTLVSEPVALDRFETGDESAFAPDELHGLALFQVHCQACHRGSQLTSDRFENNGAAVTDADTGRQRVTRDEADRGAFRVPSLRAVAGTAPYFHDGRLATLEEVVAHYDRGGDGIPGQSPRVRPLFLTAEERSALVAFLQTLDDRPAAVDLSP